MKESPKSLSLKSLSLWAQRDLYIIKAWSRLEFVSIVVIREWISVKSVNIWNVWVIKKKANKKKNS